MCRERLAFRGTHPPPEFQESVLQNTSLPTGDPRHGTHASWSTGGVCSETRAPGNFRSPRPGTSASPSSRNNHSGTRTRELKEIKEREEEGKKKKGANGNEERKRTGKG